MPRVIESNRGHASPPGGEGSEGNGAPLRLLRATHIFASTVREILQLRLLRETTPVSLTLSQLHLLKLMADNGEHQVGELAEFLGVSPPAATRNIDKLESLGLVNRAPSRDDRRATLLSVSEKGRRLVTKFESLARSHLDSAVQDFRPDEVHRLAEFLERFSVSLLRTEHVARADCLRCSAYIERGCPIGRVRGGCPYQELRDARRRREAARGDA